MNTDSGLDLNIQVFSYICKAIAKQSKSCVFSMNHKNSIFSQKFISVKSAFSLFFHYVAVVVGAVVLHI